MNEFIKIRGARVNNLKNIDIDIPINKMTCIFGPSGSGKTSIAFHTLYSESKRRFLNSFPTYLKFFSDRPAPVDVDEIFPVLPVFALAQINPILGARSSISDIMLLTQLLQSQFYHYSLELCPQHKIAFTPFSFSDYIGGFLIDNTDEVYHLLIECSEFSSFFSSRPYPSRSMKSLRSKKITEFDESHKYWEILKFKRSHLSTLDEKLKEYHDKKVNIFLYSKAINKIVHLDYTLGTYKCPHSFCHISSLSDKLPMHFSPYNALGACSKCGGFGENLEYDIDKLVDSKKSLAEGGLTLLNYKRFLGQKEELLGVLKKKNLSTSIPISKLKKDFWTILYEGEGKYKGFNELFKYLERKKYKMHVRVFIRSIQKGKICEQCSGTRLNTYSNQFFLDQKANYSLKILMELSLSEILSIFKSLRDSLSFKTTEALKSFDKILEILSVASDIGLGHLTLLRKAKTVSAGEYQRLLLLKYLSYEGTGALFVFDEPSLGLCSDEMSALLIGFKKLLKKKNTIIVIEHNDFFKKAAQHLIEMGPGAGKAGGLVVRKGNRSEFKFKKLASSLKPFSSVKRIPMQLRGSRIHEQSFRDIDIPLGGITWVRGKSGSGKTSVLINTLAAQLYYLKEGKHLNIPRGDFSHLKNNPNFDNVIIVDANLNRYTSRSTVGSMTGLFPVVRAHFLKTSMAKSLGLSLGHLSANSALGQCPKCEGRGSLVIEMQFLEDITLECEDCKGQKLKSVYASINDGVMSVHEAFSAPVKQVLDRINLTPKFQRISQYLKILNLDYLSLNRQINSLSGGEKQRIYLLSKLEKNVENSIIFFENISFGISSAELVKLCQFLQDLSLMNNTIIIIDQDEIFEFIAEKIIHFE